MKQVINTFSVLLTADEKLQTSDGDDKKTAACHIQLIHLNR